MSDPGIGAGLKKLVEVNGRVKKNEQVVVVTDETRLEMAQKVGAAAANCGAEVVICFMRSRERDGQEPPETVAAAMKNADIIFTPVCHSITHTVAMRQALNNGARAILMTAWTDELFSSPALLKTDFAQQANLCHRLGRAFSAGDNIHLTSPNGTDLKFSIKGRCANVLTNIPNPGELAPVPDIEVNVVPIEGSAQGRLVADASIPYLDIGVLREPVICTVKNGFITKIEGGKQAKILENDLLSQNNKNCFNIAELGVGLNPNATLSGIMLDDEGVLGTIHIGIGSNYTLGGKIVAPSHYDLLMWEPTIVVDGKIVQQNRDILV